VESRTSADGVSFDSWIARTGSNTPGSTLRRYIQIRIRFTIDTDSLGTGDFVERSTTLRWITSSSTVTLPAFTGVNVYEAIQKIGEFTNYEFGFGPDEVFFFRPRSTGSSLMSITQSDYNSKITGFTPGYDRVYGTVRAVYGEVVKEITDTADFPTSPKSRIANKRFEISPDSNIQIPPTADIATGIAQELFIYFSQPKKRFKLITKFLPQLDLSDVINITMAVSTPNKLWWLGDNSVVLGDKTVFLWGEKNQLAFDMDAKIIGARYDTERHNCEFDLEEVL
jgi:hypothetical protein